MKTEEQVKKEIREILSDVSRDFYIPPRTYVNQVYNLINYENLLHKHSTDRDEREMLMYLIENQNEE